MVDSCSSNPCCSRDDCILTHICMYIYRNSINGSLILCILEYLNILEKGWESHTPWTPVSRDYVTQDFFTDLEHDSLQGAFCLSQGRSQLFSLGSILLTRSCEHIYLFSPFPPWTMEIYLALTLKTAPQTHGFKESMWMCSIPFLAQLKKDSTLTQPRRYSSDVTFLKR